MHNNAIDFNFTHATIFNCSLNSWLKFGQYDMQYGDRVLVVESHKIRSVACIYISTQKHLKWPV